MRFITKVDFNKNIEASDQFCKFGFDPVPQIIEEHLKLSGWVIGIESPAVGIELIQDGQLVGEALLTIHRPRAAKIYATFPGAEHSGFVIDLALEKINLESGEILIQAVLENFQRISLADLKLSQYSFRSPKKKTFFVHVAKTAGSSFNKFLHTYLHGNSHCESYRQSSQPWEFKNLDILKSWDFVSGHLGIQYFNKNFERDQYLLVTLLRNPFDQIISHVNWLAYIHQFDHNSRFYQSHPDHIKKMGYNLCERDLTNPLEVIDFLLENKWLLNAQSSYFKTDSNNADAIIENLLNFDLVGLTEDYSQFIKKYVSLIGLEDIIEPIVNRENINSKPALNKKELLNNSKFVDFLNDYNGVDIKVYNFFYNLHKNGLDNLPAEALSISEKSLNLKRQLNLKTELNEELEQLKIKFEQQSEQLTFVQVELEKMQQDLAKTCSELQETKEELQRSQSQFDEVLAELEETHLQLHQTEAELKQSPSQLQQIQTEFPKTQTNAIQPLNDRPKCQLSICAILKDEGLYIIEWLEFHKIVGVERFYLYDNNSTDNVFEKVKPYIDRGEIVWHEWPEQAGQRSSYNHCLKHYREESEWIAFIDLDEFLFPSEADDLKKVLEEYKEYPGIGVNWLCFGSSGHISKPEGLVTENFTRRPTDDGPSAQHGGRMKSIVRTTQTIRSATPHHFIYVDDEQAVTENQQAFVGPRTPYTSVKKLRINHYLTKSKEEFRIKSQRGAGNGTNKPFAIFEKYDQNQIEDPNIQRFLPALKAAVESASQTLAEPPIKSPEHQGTIQEKTLAVSLKTVTQIVEDNRPLAAIVCGYERGGTTLVNHILKQHPHIPCIVIVRDPRALISSEIKRQISKKNPHILKKSCERYICYGRGWKSAIANGYGDRILLVQYEDLCSNPYKEAEKMFNFLGFEFDPSYLNFDPSQKKFNNVYDTKISDQYLTEYQQYLDEKTCKFILQETAEFKVWHWHPETTAHSTITPDIPPQNDFQK
ncbi:glycosyltransferase family 92 protein [Planktothrix agardhii]|uniref:glycosyltransferase family 92 protein n=1 Tax=Planktothrix agardhii TaxID=1160 RepID=UPI0020B3DC1B|nr:glycosyltransferase family 92 protein [Planktothrix agardhii]CAD5911605.1 Glycosyltransferase family 92 protein Os08g0121900 [Planktothrix agardhii]